MSPASARETLKLYLIAKKRGVIINPMTFVPMFDIKYTIELREVHHDSIALDRWLSLIFLGAFSDENKIEGKIAITPIDDIVPWLLKGLKQAVLQNTTDHLVQIIELVQLAGASSSELEVIQKSLCSGSTFTSCFHRL